MKITLLCSEATHPVTVWLRDWMDAQHGLHEVELVQRESQMSGGDLLVLISCSEIISVKGCAKYTFSLVLHASDLPKGRGWSPHIWEIIGGAETITLSLLEADKKLDSGRIWTKVKIQVPRHALWDEINQILFSQQVEHSLQARALKAVVSPSSLR